MKQITIVGATNVGRGLSTSNHLTHIISGPDEMKVSDGYHTMDELYDHRITLYIALCRWICVTNCATSAINDIAKKSGVTNRITTQAEVWRSKNHSDGKPAFGGTWYVLGIGKEPGNQITYHIPIARWDETDFAETLEKAPEWDGHSSVDVLERLKGL